MAIGDRLENLEKGFIAKWKAAQKELPSNLQMQATIAMGSLDDAITYKLQGNDSKAKEYVQKANAAASQLTPLTNPKIGTMFSLLMAMLGKVSAYVSSSPLTTEEPNISTPIYKQPITWIIGIAVVALLIYLLKK